MDCAVDGKAVGRDEGLCCVGKDSGRFCCGVLDLMDAEISQCWSCVYNVISVADRC
jgi:hypothetical protein